ncbi:MAG TPA: HAMP domain-containing sensor histidine kinase [Burkholderiales bacterium]|nr:HAMP domain-containing sensor histidine kinase [Burkholderiales bacterium]
MSGERLAVPLAHAAPGRAGAGWWKHLKPSRPRFSALNLALGFTAISIVVLATFAAPLWFAWHEALDLGRGEFLREEAVWLSDSFHKQGPEVLAATIDRRVITEPATGKIVLFTDAARHRLAGNLYEWPPEFHGQTQGFQLLTGELNGRPTRMALMRVPLAGGYELLVGRVTGRFQRLEGFFIWGLAGCTGIVLLLGVLSGLLIRRAFMAEVQSISQTASAIVEGNLTRRLPLRDLAGQGQGHGDELDMLAHTVNRMLDQIEQLIHGVRDVANAIAHDLRTPLTELRSRLEGLSLSRPPAEVTFAEVEAAVADVDRVIGIFNALLRLAEIDTGARRSGFVEVDLAKVLGDTAEFYQPVAELRGVALSCDTPETLVVSGDPLLITQAVGNLIDNALKFARERGAITVAAEQRPDGVVALTVADDGPGIGDGEKPKVSERFYRGDTSRGTPGVGLGLSLVAAVAKLHRGGLELRDNHPGLRASLVLFSIPA